MSNVCHQSDVSLCCRCCQPLTIHSSLQPNFFKSKHLKGHPEAPLPSAAKSFNVEDADDFFQQQEKKEEQQSTPSTLSKKVKTLSYVYDVHTNDIEIEHALCQECADVLMECVNDDLMKVEQDIALYQQYLQKEEDKGLVASFSEEGGAREDEDLEREEAELEQQLAALKAELRNQETQIVEELEKVEVLQQRKEKLYLQHKGVELQLGEIEDENEHLKSELKYTQFCIDKWHRVKALEVVFEIRERGPFLAINSFRFGRSAGTTIVPWPEINHAWGQTTFLLHSLANHINFSFKRFSLVPFGACSYIKAFTDSSSVKELPLYFSGGIKFFWDTKFDQAMLSFLECFQQLVKELQRNDKTFKLPYEIVNGRLQEAATSTSCSIKAQFNSEEQWTKALKFLLTNLKWSLSWVCNQFTPQT